MEVAAGAALEVLVQNLINVSRDEISLIRGLEKDAEKLKETLAMLQSFLYDAEDKPITDYAVKRWLKNLEDVAFDADNVLDELNYDRLSKEIKAIEAEKKKKVPSCFPSFNHCVRRRQMALRIKEINKTFESINKNATDLGLQRRLEEARAAPADTLPETDSFTVDPVFLGRDDDASRIVKMLTTIPNEQVLSILPIVGMGGLGKTTLARKVYHDQQIRTHFQTHIWVHVSTTFDPKILFKNILSSLRSTSAEVAASTREDLLKELQGALGARTYLLVLDDVWNQDRKKWEDFINPLLGISPMKGNGIIVTTRDKRVASIVHTLPIYELKVLAEDICWSIIEAKAFGGGKNIPLGFEAKAFGGGENIPLGFEAKAFGGGENIPLGFEDIGRSIARRCQGLPLAANVVGGVLRGKPKDEWLTIEKKWLSGVENNISKILRLSYDNLHSPSLKKCFAYCSIFSKGDQIETEELIELWMAEGFLQANQRNDMETVGNNFFNVLLQNSLLLIARRDVLPACNMHDLVHDLACSVLGSSTVHDDISAGIYQARYVGCNCHGDDSSLIPKEQAKLLRTLIFKGEISNIMLSDFKSPHVLKLMDIHAKELPCSIGELIHLRYLNISWTSIESLPDSVGKLHHLQTLRTGHHFRKLPSTLKSLISLRHLHIWPEVKLPSEIGRLTSLQTLKHFDVGKEKGHRIEELGSLQNLKGELNIDGLENVHDKEEAKSASLYQKPDIVKLGLRWKASREGETNDKNVLEGLQPHPNLKSLEIDGLKGRSFPLWTLKMAVRDESEGRWVGLNNLVEIRLSDCKECEEIPMLGHLPNLKSVCLVGLANVRSIGSSFYGIDNFSTNGGVCKETSIGFPALERLELGNMSHLTDWEEAEFPTASETQPREVKVFPCLKYLRIFNCKQLRSAPSHFPVLQELDIGNMGSIFNLADICGIKLTSLRRLRIEGLDGLVYLPNWLLCNNQNILGLQISNCPNLKELPNDLHTLNSLEWLCIENCPELKSIPYPSCGQSQGFTSLRSLEISNCKGLIDLPCEMVVSCAPSVRTLVLDNLSSAMNLPVIIDCLQKMPRLTKLKIVNVPKFIISFSVETVSLRSLQQLTLGPSLDSSDFVSFKENFDGVCQVCQSLRDLTLVGMEHWDSLPDSLQHLTALSFLRIEKFGIEELPEWFGNLSSLSRLFLSDCQKLRRLPSVEAMRRLTQLYLLNIDGCPLLRVKQPGDNDSEWDKISHIPHIWVDGSLIQVAGQKVSESMMDYFRPF